MGVRRIDGSGFILVATLWVLAGLGLLAAYIDDLTDQNVKIALLHKQNIQGELDQLSTQATLVYLFTTSRANDRALILEKEQHLSSAGSEITFPPRSEQDLLLDGTPYRGVGDVVFSILDEGSLASVNSHQFLMFSALMRSIGLSDSQQSLVAGRLQDYTDEDQVLSLNGAEFFEYQQKQLPLPANGLMKTPIELRKILGFSELFTRQQWEAIRPYLSMRQSTGYNFNIIPRVVLMGIFANKETVVDTIMALRKERALRSVREVEAVVGEQFNLDNEDIAQFPSAAVRISLWQKNSSMRTLSGVEFTPFEELSPWRTDYHYSEQQYEATNEQDSDQPKNAPTALL